jgi:hypothetical protein
VADDEVKSDTSVTQVLADKVPEEADLAAVNGETAVVKIDVNMEAVLKTMNKHLKRAVNRCQCYETFLYLSQTL